MLAGTRVVVLEDEKHRSNHGGVRRFARPREAESAGASMQNETIDFGAWRPIGTAGSEPPFVEQARRVPVELPGATSAGGPGDGGAPAWWLTGTSRSMREIRAFLRQIAPTRTNVLISGESGTGKEMAARALHGLSPRRSAPFVAVNCAAMTETLIESELFGHEKGSFTGAGERRRGCFEQANGGTLLLDEISEMPMQTQAKLLRVLEDSRVRRVGGKTDFEVDVRVVAATNKRPEEAVRNRELREDLYYRLNVFHIQMPPLRERKADIPSVVETLLSILNRKHCCRITGLAEAVLNAFHGHEWPGNIRELRNVLERAVILAGEGIIGLKHLALPARIDVSAQPSTGTTLLEMERRFILKTLEQTGNRKRHAAALLGISVRTLYNRLREYGMEPGAGVVA